MLKTYVYIPVYNLYFDEDTENIISAGGFELLEGLSIILTPNVVKKFYTNTLSEESIRTSFSGKMRVKLVKISSPPKYCLSIDKDLPVGLYMVILTFLHVIKPSNINTIYSLVFDVETNDIIFQLPSESSFVTEVTKKSSVSYNKVDLLSVSKMINTYLKYEKNELILYASTKVGAAVQFFRQSLQYNDIFLTILFYAVALECLFSPGKGELRHRISENAAFFLEPADSSKRLALYRNLEKFYDIRSEFVHSGESKTFRKYGVDLINYTRDILVKSIVKILSNSDIASNFADDEKRPEYLENLVIGRPAGSGQT